MPHDELESTRQRRIRGRFFTKDAISTEIAKIVKALVNPTYILEPYVGEGSLIASLVKAIPGAANDINQGFINALITKFAGLDWTFTCINTITTDFGELFKLWKVPLDTERLLILTNPPFGSSATNILVSKKGEVEKGKSRKITIAYGGLERYGKGDLVIPAIAKLIEFLKKVGKGYLAFFSPAGIFCGRVRYNKLLIALLTDFKYLDGYLFSGENFNSISKRKPITFTIWQYQKGCKTQHPVLKFIFEDKIIRLKQLPLLKDGWQYDTRKVVHHEIAVQGCDRFNVAAPKIFHSQVQKGGSELVPENVKIDLNIPHLPSELVYGLWSATVGYRSITAHPIYMDNAYTHLPDFSKPETLEILAYVVLHVLITELLNQYTQGQIGFVGIQRLFRFGGPPLTAGARYLLDTHPNCPIGTTTIGQVFHELQATPDTSKIDTTYRSLIRAEIEKRLEAIGYWKYLPIP